LTLSFPIRPFYYERPPSASRAAFRIALFDSVRAPPRTPPARNGIDDRIYVAKYTDVKLERHAEQLAALGHVARVAILRAVVQAGPDGLSTTDLQEKLDIPWTTLTHHLDRVVEAGLVIARKEGKSVFHTADYKALRALTDFLWEDCCKGGKGSKNCC
jgi:DNA-binding transcriptional ArsR family regulator